MKRQKRDMSHRAYHRGYHAGLAGKSRDACPHSQGDLREQWVSGWREGRSDSWSALTGISGLQNVARHEIT